MYSYVYKFHHCISLYVNAHKNVMLQCIHVLYIFAQQCGYDLYVHAFLLYVLLPVCVAYVCDCCVPLHLCVNETLPEFSIAVYMKSCLYQLCIWPLHYAATSLTISHYISVCLLTP